MDLVEQQHKGIFSVLDEACMNVGKVTDEVFLQGLNGKLAKHAHYTSRKVGNTKYMSDLVTILMINQPFKSSFGQKRQTALFN